MPEQQRGGHRRRAPTWVYVLGLLAGYGLPFAFLGAISLGYLDYRPFAALATVLAAVLLAAWVLASFFKTIQARYDGGLTFSGVAFVGRRVRFNRVSWSRPPGSPARCPLVVRLPGADLGEAELSSPQALRGVGARVQNEFGDFLDLVLLRKGFSLAVCYKAGALAHVIVGGRLAGGIAVGGKTLPLPVSEGELVRVLGDPRSREVLTPP